MLEKVYRFETIRKERYHYPNKALADLDITELDKMLFYKVTSDALEESQLKRLSDEVFADPITEDCYYDSYLLEKYFSVAPTWVVSVEYLPGVTDNSGKSAETAIEMVLELESIKACSGAYYFIYENHNKDEVAEYVISHIANPLIESFKIFSFVDFCNLNRFQNVQSKQVEITKKQDFEPVDLNISDEELIRINQANVWALTLSELKIIRDYYQTKNNSQLRLEKNLPQMPTNVEMEILAQTWSEHCKHKIFSAYIDYQESALPNEQKKLGKFSVDGLYPSYIKGVTKKIAEDFQLDWLMSVFKDNAGVVRFSDKVDLSIKVETHNSPSALDPYGGALTGIVGVNRDILGVGLGSRPIANTNVLCFAPPTWPEGNKKNELPIGLLHPKRVMQGVHRGIEDGGNKSGIPTVNGAFYFDYNYAGKPLVYCGTLGVMPQKSETGRSLIEKNHEPGHRVVMVGGKIGVDGIHGATFSSLELDEKSPSTAVQIGDPLTQRRLTDFMMMAQTLELFSAVTDNGAGGLSSSVGEMAEKTNGAVVDVAKAPTKYPGVSPFELIVSESQERMTFAVAPERLNEFLSLAKSYDVVATDIGYFCNSGYFEVLYQDKTVALLDMEFLHDGLPQMQLKANFEGEKLITFKEEKKQTLEKFNQESATEVTLKLLSSHNIRSKEQLVRQYDQEVQAATIVKPFIGKKQIGPANSGVIWLYPHGGDEQEAVAIGCGLNPRLSYYDTYLMTEYAFDEAVRNLVCQGVNPNKIAMVDNFCWPDPLEKESNPDAQHKLAQLVRSGRALYDIAYAYQMPLVSGKDSMKNDFIGKMPNGCSVKISVPPTLLMTAIGHIEDVDNVITSDFKNSGDYIFLLGPSSRGLKYSEFERYFSLDCQAPDYINYKKQKELYLKIYKASQNKLLASCHDISDGGLVTALAESSIGGSLGVYTQIESDNPWQCLFSERAGRFVVSVKESSLESFRNLFNEEISFLGRVTDKDMIINVNNEKTIQLAQSQLVQAWRQPW